MTALISLFIILTLSLLITRIMTVALTLTGLSREAAQFQASSAFTGAGFTTTEAEKVVNHPVRRRIVLITMILGNVGVVTSITSLVLAFVGLQQSDFLVRLLWLGLGLAALWLAAASSWLDHHLSRLISWALERWTDLNVRDYTRLLNLSGDYQVTEIQVDPDSWLVDRTLSDLDLNQEGVLVLGIHRSDGDYVGAPTGKTCLRTHDTLVLYGRSAHIKELEQRQVGAAGDLAHHEAVDEQKRVVSEQEKKDAKNN